MVRNINKIMIVVITTLFLIWCGMKLMGTAKDFERVSHDRMAKIDSIFENN